MTSDFEAYCCQVVLQLLGTRPLPQSLHACRGVDVQGHRSARSLKFLAQSEGDMTNQLELAAVAVAFSNQQKGVVCTLRDVFYQNRR